MRVIFLLLLAGAVAVACTPKNGSSSGAEADIIEREGTGEGQFNAHATFDSSLARSDDCDDQGGTHVNLHYGNYRIKTAGNAFMKAGEIFAIKLHPHNNAHNRPGIDYETETVTISGKDMPSVWLTASGSYNSTAPDHQLIICVPLGTPDGLYYYNIEITQTGSLDPRAEVY